MLILDDVWSSDVVKTFNVSGRVLITTQDVSVVDVIPQSQRTVVEVGKDLFHHGPSVSKYKNRNPIYTEIG